MKDKNKDSKKKQIDIGEFEIMNSDEIRCMEDDMRDYLLLYGDDLDVDSYRIGYIRSLWASGQITRNDYEKLYKKYEIKRDDVK